MAKKATRKHYSYKVLNAIWRLYKGGVSKREIADKFNRTPPAIHTTVWKIEKMHQLEGEELANFIEKHGAGKDLLKFVVRLKNNQVDLTPPKEPTVSLEELIGRVEKARELYDEAMIDYAMEVAKREFKKKEGEYEDKILGLQNQVTELQTQQKQSRLSQLLKKKVF